MADGLGMGSLVCRWMLTVTLALTLAQTCQGGGFIEIHFLKYQGRCKTDFLRQCDPYFKFCLGNPQTPWLLLNKWSVSRKECIYAQRTTDHYHDTDVINWENESNMEGLENPWKVQIVRFDQPSVSLAIQIKDADAWPNPDDHVKTFGINMQEKVWETQSEASWSTLSATEIGYEIRFKVRLYCEDHFYTPSCNVSCQAKDSNADGHFTCEKGTGKKVCMPGWEGPECKDNTNECERGVCIHGRCTDSPGSYSCDCFQGYTGKNCDRRLNPCSPNPCQNAGVCVDHHNGISFSCNCRPQWEGEKCQTRKDPCEENPCRNEAVCQSSYDKTTYSCICQNTALYTYTGRQCEIATRKDPCDENPCRNEAVCQSSYDKTTYSCICQNTNSYTYTGSQCEIAIPVTTTAMPTTPASSTVEPTTLTARTVPPARSTVEPTIIAASTTPSTRASATSAETRSDSRTTGPTQETTTENNRAPPNVARQSGGDGDSGFPLWYIGIIGGCLLLLIVIVLLALLCRRRRKKAASPPASPTASSEKNAILFENNLYMHNNRLNTERDRNASTTRHLPPTPTEAKPIDPAKSVYSETDETENSPDYRQTQPGGAVADTGRRVSALSERSEPNPYTDFNTLSRYSKLAELGDKENLYDNPNPYDNPGKDAVVTQGQDNCAFELGEESGVEGAAASNPIYTTGEPQNEATDLLTPPPRGSRTSATLQASEPENSTSEPEYATLSSDSAAANSMTPTA